MPELTKKLPLEGWRRRDAFLDANPHLRSVLPHKTSLDWAIRLHRRELSPFLARLGRTTMVHDAAGPKFVELLLRVGEGETA